MSVGSSLQAGVRLLVDRPSSVLPVYLLVLGLTAAARTPFLLAIVVVLALLAADGRLETLVAETESAIEGINPDVEPTPENIVETFPEGLENAILDVLTPTVVALVLAGFGLSILVALVATALGNAAALDGLRGALEDDDAVRAAVVGIARDWRPFVGLALLRAAIVVLAVLPVLAGLALVSVSPLAGGIVTAVAALFGVGVLVVASLLLAFAGQSIVLDRAGLAEAIRASAGFPFDRPVAFVGYVVVAIGVFGLFSALSTAFGLLGVSPLSGIVWPLLLVPFLDTFKLALYADRSFPAVTSSDAEPPRTPRASSTEATVIDPKNAPSTSAPPPSRPRRVVAAFTGGLRSLGGFISHHPIPIIAAGGIFALAAIGGFELTADLGTELPLPEDVRGVFGTFPVGTFVMLAANNWLVSATAAYGGVALGVPTLFDMLLNGALVGAVYGVTDSLAFLALVGPHGILELPAIFVAGGLGFHIAAITIGALVGRRPIADLVVALRLAYRVLLGLAVVLLVAAFIEAFVTPAVAAAVLG